MNYYVSPKELFSKPGIFNKMSRNFELQPWISLILAWTQHYMPVPHKPCEAKQAVQNRWVIYHCSKEYASLL
jgi:hypothetical protein